MLNNKKESGGSNMSNDDFKKRLDELIKIIGGPPVSRKVSSGRLSGRILGNKKDQKMERILKPEMSVQESFDYFRVLLKDTLHNLEATRRERDDFKKQLEGKGK